MQLSELSVASGLPIPTIKFYVREGLLPPGDTTGGGRAEYGPEHLRRLSMIRALVQVGDLPLAAVAEIVAAVDDDSTTLHHALGSAHHALAARSGTSAGSPELDGARAEVDAFLDALGWRVSADAPDRDELATALVILRELGWKIDTSAFSAYAEAADRIAAWELARVPDAAPREIVVENAVVGTVVFDSVLSSLRRLAEEHHSAERLA